VRIFFATDVHGSETCWRKFLNSGQHYGADAIILGGDMTGKALVPVIHDGGDAWHATLLENRESLVGEEAVAAFEDAVVRRGYYPFRSTPEEVQELHENEAKWHALFSERMLGTVGRWMEIADEKLAGTGIDCYVCPGNDDQLEVDDVIAKAKHVNLAEGRIVELDGYQMASSGWSNPTPWDTYREEQEPQLAERIRTVVQQITTPPERTIFSLHCPPYRSTLDDAPQLTAEMDLKEAGRATVPVGSKAVREAIEEFQPALGLHGHIHEARGSTRIGNTLCINPGSSYEQGMLLGAVVELDGKKKIKRFMLTSG
jgi:Icc-related predicted phosphoesterase